MAQPARRRRSGRAAAGRGRAGRVPAWIPLAVLASGAVWLCASLQRSAAAAGFAIVDVRRSRLDAGQGFADPRWQEFLALRLSELPQVDANDRRAVRAVAAEIAALSFVAEVGEPRVVWPDGLEVPLRLRAPAACVLAGTDYLAVSDDGVILPGRWPAPPLVAARFLPVLGPNDGRFDGARPGQRLAAPSDLDALALAVSMRAELAPEDFAVAGPPLIDATRARATSDVEPGARILLEGRRTIHFGRAPGAGRPGELPTALKWQHVRRALAALRTGSGAARPAGAARDWALLDVRWDVADIAWRVEAGAQADTGGTAAREPDADRR